MQLVLPRLSLAGNLEKLLMSFYWTEWRERGYGLWYECHCVILVTSDIFLLRKISK
jgi:hypothetical protein